MKDAFKKGFGFTVGSMLGYATLLTIAKTIIGACEKKEKPDNEPKNEADKNE